MTEEYPIDLEYVEYKHDLMRAVLPLWDAAGITHENYSLGGGGDLFMLPDDSRMQEALNIVEEARLRLVEQYYMNDGIPRYPVDLPHINFPGDLTDVVLPQWNKAGIAHRIYSAGTTGNHFMIRDQHRHAEARAIAHRLQSELEEKEPNG